MEITLKNNILQVKDVNNVCINCDTHWHTLSIGEYAIDFPGEYEKSWILAEAYEFDDKIFYRCMIEGKVVVFLFYDDFELKEEIISFFGDIDVLCIIWTKHAAKITENIEAKVVIPFGEAKDIFLNNVGQSHPELVTIWKSRWEIPGDTTVFINLWEKD